MSTRSLSDLQNRIDSRIGKTPRRLAWLFPLSAFYIPFLVLPIILVFIGSFFRWEQLAEAQFVGLDNYIWALTTPLFYRVLGNTFLYTLGNTTLTVGGGLFLALMVYHTYSWLRQIYQVIFLIPYAIMSVGVGMIWQLMYHPRTGAVNELLELTGLLSVFGLESAPLWTGSSTLALPSIIVAGAWWSIGFYTVIWMVGLANIDKTLYEAAKIDGANPIQTFRYITLPQLKPIGLFLVIISIITSLRVFGLVWVMTQGGPARASEVMVTWMYKLGFIRIDMGRAATVGVLLFIVTMFVAMLTIRSAGLEDAD